MSTEASIQKGKGLLANPEFFLTFGLALVLGIMSSIVVIGSFIGTDPDTGAIVGARLWAIVVVGVVAATFAVAWFSGLGEKLFVGIVALSGVLSGILSTVVIGYLWWAPEGDGGHGSPLYAILMVIGIIALPIASIAGERILPLFIGFLAAVWGVLSVIVFVMVVFIGVE